MPCKIEHLTAGLLAIRIQSWIEKRQLVCEHEINSYFYNDLNSKFTIKINQYRFRNNENLRERQDWDKE